MTNKVSLVRHRTPEEEEAAAKEAEVGRLQDELATIHEETEALRMRLAHFETEYTAAIAPYYLRLDRWHLRCEEVRWSIAQLSRLKQTAKPSPPNTDTFRQERQDQFRAQWEDLNAQEHDDAPRPTLPVESALSQTDEAELRQLYRALAKRFHPDLATNSEVKAARELKMKEINAAYQARNLRGLRAMTDDPDIVDAQTGTIGEKLVRLIREIARLRRVVEEASAGLQVLRNSDSGRLLAQFDQARAVGQDGFALLINAVIGQIEQAKEEWVSLRAEEAELWKAVD